MRSNDLASSPADSLDISRIYRETRRRSLIFWVLGGVWAIVTLVLALFLIFSVKEFAHTQAQIGDLEARANSTLDRLTDMENTLRQVETIHLRTTLITALNIQERRVSGEHVEERSTFAEELTRFEKQFVSDVVKIVEPLKDQARDAPWLAEAFLLLGNSHYEEAESGIRNGEDMRKILEEFRDSIEPFKTALEKRPRSGYILFKLARAETLSGSPRDGISRYESAVQLSGANDRTRYIVLQEMGLAQILAHDYDRAIDTFKKAATLANDIDWPDERTRKVAGAEENIGLVYLNQKKWTEALDNTQRVEAINNKMAWNSLIRAIAAGELSDVSTSDNAFKEWSQNKRPDDGFVRFYISAALQKKYRIFVGPQPESQIKRGG